MKDILITGYLFIMLVISWNTITTTIDAYTKDFLYKDLTEQFKQFPNYYASIRSLSEILALITCLMWSIWYMYIIN